MNDIAKLPKWAQDRLKSAERAARDARDACAKTYESQEITGVWQYVYDGVSAERRKAYIDAHSVEFHHAGVWVRVMLPTDNRGIELWWGENENMGGEVAMIPESYQKVLLVTAPNMRTQA